MKKQYENKYFISKWNIFDSSKVIIVDEKEETMNPKLTGKLINIVKKLDKIHKVYDENSVILNINFNTWIKEIKVDKEFNDIINWVVEVAKKLKIEDKNLYDITIYSL